MAGRPPRAAREGEPREKRGRVEGKNFAICDGEKANKESDVKEGRVCGSGRVTLWAARKARQDGVRRASRLQ